MAGYMRCYKISSLNPMVCKQCQSVPCGYDDDRVLELDIAIHTLGSF